MLRGFRCDRGFHAKRSFPVAFLCYSARLYVKKFIQSRRQSNQLRGAESLSEGPKFESVFENYKNSSKAIMPHSSDQLELFNELTFI